MGGPQTVTGGADPALSDRAGSLGPLVEPTRAMAAAAGRADLTRRLDDTARRLAEPGIRALVVGEFKQGKSLLVNAMVNAPICAVDDDIATSVPTMVRQGDPPRATLVYAPADLAVDAESGRGAGRDRSGAPAGQDTRGEPTGGIELIRESVDIHRVAESVATASRPARGRRLAFAEVDLPRSLLDGGLVIVDTPGVGGIGSGHHAATMAILPTADAVLLVTDASQELTGPEADFLRQAESLCPNVACVLTKTDLYPHWRDILALDRHHLATVSTGAIPVFPISSTLRLHAARHRDSALNEESGFPALSRYLRRDVVGKAGQLVRRSVANDVQYALDNLSVSVQSELTALRDPDHQRSILAGLEAAKARADALGKRSARWQQALNDGVADLQSDIEYDFRDRSRLIVREAEEVLDQADPSKVWDQFAEWFQQRIAAAVDDNFVWAHERSRWLAAQIGEFFAEEGGHALPDVAVADTLGVLDPVPEFRQLDEDKLNIGGKLLIGMRGSYGGVLMFGLLTGVMGFALINPISVGAGVILGTKAYRDEKASRLKRRQAETKTAVRRHMDDVVLHVGKESKDRLRQVQRMLRDHFTEIADEMRRTLADATSAAQSAARADAAQRDDRLRQLVTEQKQLDDLLRHARAVLGEPAAAAPGLVRPGAANPAPGTSTLAGTTASTTVRR